MNESRLLQEKYYRQKQQFHSLLWTSMSENPSALGPIPPIDKALLDPGGGGDGGGAVVGAYTCGALIGRGQFASVRACTRTRDKTEWAIKIVKKSRLTKLSHVKRMKVSRRLAERVSQLLRLVFFRRRSLSASGGSCAGRCLRFPAPACLSHAPPTRTRSSCAKP